MLRPLAALLVAAAVLVPAAPAGAAAQGATTRPPGSRPLSDEDPDIAPDLVPLRERLMAMVNRPVNIQAARDVVMYVRGELAGQPYLVLIDKASDDDA